MVGADAFALLICSLFDHFILRVLRDVDQYWTWSSSTRDVECFCNGRCNVFCLCYLNIPLGNRDGCIHNICFLESICAQKMCEYLSRNANNRR